VSIQRLQLRREESPNLKDGSYAVIRDLHFGWYEENAAVLEEGDYSPRDVDVRLGRIP
jgi:hypothetical protein